MTLALFLSIQSRSFLLISEIEKGEGQNALPLFIELRRVEKKPWFKQNLVRNDSHTGQNRQHNRRGDNRTHLAASIGAHGVHE